MITPIFEITQESDFLIISICVPYTRTSEFDLYIDGEDFKFYAKPYFLRLTLPGRIVEDGREKASFDVGKGIFTLRVPKETPGEPFEGLQMLTSLLAPKGSRSAKPLVEETELSGECVAESDDEDFDWEVDQEVQVEITEEELGGLYKYGFGNQRAGIFTRLQDELSDVIDVKSPDSTSAAERRQGRLAAETAKFEPDHYLADLFEDDAVQDVLKYRPWWVEVESKKKIKEEITQGHDGGEGAVFFSEEEKEQLRKFSNKSYLLDKKATHQVWISLVDIILAYVYEVRVTEGEKNVESPWNIRKLSGTLSWLETYNSVQEVLVSFGRRVLCYPLYRHFALIKAAIEDAAVIFELGKVCVLKCLLDIHKVFRENDPAYILNDLYITDYCVWIQKAKSKKVRALTEHLKKATLCKSDLELELDELETAAQLVKVEEEEEDSRQAARYRESIPESDSKEDSEEDDGSSSSSSSSAESDECSSDKEDSLDRLQSCFLEKASPPRAANIPEANPVTQHLDCEAGPRGEEEPLFVKLPGFPLSQPMPRKLIEELGDQVCSVVRLSEQPEGTDSRGCDVVQGERDKPSVQSAEHTVLRPATAETAASQGTFLEVCPQRNPLLIIADCDDDVEDS